MKFLKHSLLCLALLTPACLLSACSSSTESKVALKEVPERLAGDSEETRIYNAALNAFDRGIYSVAQRHIKLFRDSYPMSSLTPDIVLKEADTYFHSGKYTEAVSAYQEFARIYMTHEANPYALFMLGRAQLEQYRDSFRDQEPLNLALKAFRELRKDYPNSEYHGQSRIYLKEIWEEQAKHELNVAQFYLEAEDLVPAAGRVALLRKNYPSSLANKELSNLLNVLDQNKRLQVLALSDTVPVPEPKLIEEDILTFHSSKHQLENHQPENHQPENHQPDFNAKSEAESEGLLASAPKFMLATKASSPETTGPAIASPKKSSIKLLQKLHCEKSGDWLVFSTLLSDFKKLEDYKIESKNDSSLFIKRMAFNTTPKSSITRLSEKPVPMTHTLHCSIEDEELLVRETTNGKGETLVDFGINFSKKIDTNQIETIVLDRPNRVITLVKLGSS